MAGLLLDKLPEIRERATQAGLPAVIAAPLALVLNVAPRIVPALAPRLYTSLAEMDEQQLRDGVQTLLTAIHSIVDEPHTVGASATHPATDVPLPEVEAAEPAPEPGSDAPTTEDAGTATAEPAA